MSTPPPLAANPAADPAATPAARPGRLLLVRHGRTAWSQSGQHTGLTDIPLDDVGEAQARALPALLGELVDGQPALVASSPLQRARRTAELAGVGGPGGIVVDADLVEWDYGAYEGLTTAQIRAQRHDDWTIFADGVAPGGPGQPPGEDLAAVAARCTRVLARVEGALGAGDVLLFAHGHVLRVLAAVRLGLDPRAGASLLLDPASVCVLDTEHGVPGIRHWNLTPALFAG